MLDKLFLQLEKITPARYRWVWNHEGFRRYFANTGWMFFGQIFSLILSFFIGAWLARYLGPTNYGIINYTVAFAGLFGFIATLGVDAILVRELVKNPEKRDELMGTSFVLKLIGGVVALLLVTVAAFAFETSTLNRLFIIIFSFGFITQSVNVIYHYFQAEVRAKYNSLSQLAATIATNVLKIVFILVEADLVWIIIIFAADSVWQTLFFLYYYKRQGLKLSTWKFNKSLAKQILAGSKYLMLSAAAAFVLFKIDQVMIGRLLGEGAVGLYAAAAKFGEIWYFLPGILCASLFPAIINSRTVSETLFKQRLINFYTLMFVISILIATATSVLARPVVLLLFGQDYAASVGLLQIYVWSGVGLFMAWAIQQRLTAEDRMKAISNAYLVAMVINVILNYFFITRFGLTGAAWATLIAYSLLPVMMMGRKRR
ncbi:MAG: flippase [bacterium]|nr:flippase [bacterium]